MGKPKAKKTFEVSAVALNLRRIGAYAVLILITFVCLFPFYILIVNSTRAHAEIQKGFSFIPGGFLSRNFTNLLKNENMPIFRAMLNSLIISTGSALVATYFSALTAYGVHAYSFKLKNAAYRFILMVMMIPGQVSALGFIRLMMQFKLVNSFIPFIVPAIASPAVFFFMKQYMEGALPGEIIEAARIDGSGEFRTFNSIIMPIMKPAIAVQAIFAFVFNWNNYFLPALLLSKKEMKTIPILIAQLRSADYLRFDMGQVYVMITFSIIPVLLAYLFLSKFIIRGVAMGSVKG
jgi:multiple sugar transport system permease protein